MDWRDGRIQGWIDPPALANTVTAVAAAKLQGGVKADYGVGVEDQKEIVKEWAAEFKLDGLWGDGGEMEVEMEG